MIFQGTSEGTSKQWQLILRSTSALTMCINWQNMAKTLYLQQLRGTVYYPQEAQCKKNIRRKFPVLLSSNGKIFVNSINFTHNIAALINYTNFGAN